MADGETRVWRPVLSGGVVMVYGTGFWHGSLAGHVGEVVGVDLGKDGKTEAMFSSGRVPLQPIEDFACGNA